MKLPKLEKIIVYLVLTSWPVVSTEWKCTIFKCFIIRIFPINRIEIRPNGSWDLCKKMRKRLDYLVFHHQSGFWTSDTVPSDFLNYETLSKHSAAAFERILTARFPEIWKEIISYKEAWHYQGAFHVLGRSISGAYVVEHRERCLAPDHSAFTLMVFRFKTSLKLLAKV